MFKNLLDKYRHYTTPATLSTLDGLPYWREKLLLAFLFIMVRLAMIAYIPSIILGIYSGLWNIVIVDSIVYGLTFFIYYKHSYSYKLKTYILLSVLYFLGVVLLFNVGAMGAGYLWLFFVPIIAAFLLKGNQAFLFSAANVVVLIIFGVLRYFDLYVNPLLGPFYYESWIIITANFIALDLFTVFAIVLLINGLADTLESEIKIHHNLENQADELVSAKEKAEKANALKTAFLAQISHEIRTPVNTILSFVTLLEEDIKERRMDSIQAYFAAIEKGGTRIYRTIELIIDMAELQAGTYEPNFEEINLDEKILTPIFDEFKIIAANQGVELRYSNEVQGAVNIRADSYTMSRIFIHLIDNAVKYTPNGEVRIIMKENDSNYVVEVKDNGIGISIDYLSDLFEPFSQEEYGYTRKFEGTGLGLPLVKRYCDLNKSIISVKSAKGKGSIFTVVIPKIRR